MRKIGALALLLVLLMNCFIMLNFIGFPSKPLKTIINTPNPLTNATTPELLQNFTNTGDFLNWQNISNTWTYLETYSSELRGYLTVPTPSLGNGSVLCTAMRYLTDVDTATTLTHYKFHINLQSTRNYFSIVEFLMVYQDGTNQTLYYMSFTRGFRGQNTTYDYNVTIAGNFTYGKFCNGLLLIIFVTTPNSLNARNMLVQIYDEAYLGSKLRPISPTYAPTEFRVNTPVLFACKTDHIPTYSIALAISFTYQSTGYTSPNIFLTPDWTDNSYYKSIPFNNTGYYLFNIALIDYIFNYASYTSNYQFYVYSANEIIYPCNSTLTLWNPLGIAIPTNLKVFLGESETYELYMPQINRALAFIPYAANTTTRPIHITEAEQKYAITASNNGIKAIIPSIAGLYPNIELYESLVFDFKLINYAVPTILIGIDYFQADYTLNLNSSYQNKWVQYIIPFEFFAFHNYTNALAQICFFSAKLLQYEIKNIFVADYHNLTAVMTNAINSTSQYEQSPLKYSTLAAFTNVSQSSLAHWQNSTNWLNETYASLTCDTHYTQIAQNLINTANSQNTWQNTSEKCLETNFNVTGYQSTNITIATNQTVKLNTTPGTSTPNGDYLGLYSFTDDANGGSAANWWGTDDVVNSIDSHHKVLHSSGTCHQTFASPQQAGTYELWVYYESSSSSYSVLCAFPIFFFVCNGYFGYKYGEGYEYQLQVCDLYKWYHITITWHNSPSDGWEVSIDGTHYGYPYQLPVYNGYSISSGLTQLDCGYNVEMYLDAVDYSWASGYYVNRNMVQNQTVTPSLGYKPHGFYISPIFDLGSVPLTYYQQLHMNTFNTTNGFYNATWSFTNDINGEVPTGWSGTSTVIQSYQGHTKVANATGAAGIYNSLTQTYTARNNGSIELWFYDSASTGYISLIGKEYYWSYEGFELVLDFTTGLWLWNYSAYIHITNNLTANAWNHLRISFNCVQHNYELYLNKMYLGIYWFDYQLPASYIDCLLFASNTLTFYDAIDYSWTAGYFANRNYNPLALIATIQYRTSTNGVSFSSWSTATSENQSINANSNRYFQFCLNLTNSGYLQDTPQVYWVNLSYILSSCFSNLSKILYYNFTIPKANLMTLTLTSHNTISPFQNQNINIPYLAVAGSTHLGSSGFNEAVGNYIDTQSNDTSAYKTDGFASTLSQLFFASSMYLEFSLSGINLNLPLKVYVHYAANWTSIQPANLTIYNFHTSQWDLLSALNTSCKALWFQVTLTNSAYYVNSTHNLRLRIMSGMGFNSPFYVYDSFCFFVQISQTLPPYTLKLFDFNTNTWNSLSTSPNSTNSFSLDYYNITNVKLAFFVFQSQPFSDSYNFTLAIAYFYYTNVTAVYYYTLSPSTLFYYYNFNISYLQKQQTSVSFYWQSSTNNITFSMLNSSLSVQALRYRHLKYTIHVNTLTSWNFSQFYSAKLFFQYRNITYYYLHANYQTTFLMPTFFINTTLTVNRSANINYLLNSSITVFIHSNSTYYAFESVNAYHCLNLTSVFYNSTHIIKFNLTIFSYQAFTFQFRQAELKTWGYTFNKTCYLNASMTLPASCNELFYYNFSTPAADGKVYLYFTFPNGTKSLVNTYADSNNALVKVFFFSSASAAAQINITFKFVYPFAYNNDLNLTATIARYFIITNDSYRLLSDSNRQSASQLQFKRDLQWLCLTDYYNTIIYKQQINRTAVGYFVDVKINYFEVYFANYVPDTMVTYNITNRNLNISVTVPYGMIIPIPLFTDDYVVVQYLTDNKTVINIWDLTISAVHNRLFKYNVTIPIKGHGEANPYAWAYYLFIIPPVILLLIIIQRIRKKRKVKLSKKPLKPAIPKPAIKPKPKPKEKYYLSK